MQLSKFLLVLICVVFLVNVHADNKRDFFVGNGVVEDQSNSQKTIGYKKAFKEVIVKLTGNRVSLQNTLIQNAMNKVEYFVSSFSYSIEQPSNILDQKETVIHVEFEKDAMLSLLRDANLPVWDFERPAVMLWVVIDQDGSRQLASQSDSQLIIPFLKTLQTRKIPAFLPLFDLDDQAKINIRELWGGYQEKTIAASNRYGISNVLVGRVFIDPTGRWQSMWQFYGPQINFSWHNEHYGDLAVLLENAASEFVDHLSQYYAHNMTIDHAEQLSISLLGVNDVKQYVTAVNYLQELIMVEDLQPVSFSKGLVELEVVLTADIDSFTRLLNLDGRFKVIPIVSDELNPQAIENIQLVLQ